MGVIASFRQSWEHFGAFLPRLLGALLLLALGWIFAKFVRRIAIQFFKAVRVDTLADKSGIEAFLSKGGIKVSFISILAGIIYWFILFSVILATVESLGLEVAAELLRKIVLYLPNVAIATVILSFGTMAAQVLKKAAYTYFNNIGIQGASAISNVISYAILVFVFSIVLEQLQIGGQILVSAFQMAFGALCLAAAIAFGLGGKDSAAKVVEGVLRNERKNSSHKD